jgi:hypothetical protein
MAVDDSGKQATLFPCLAILRYTVATVVTVLAVVVIVMVIAVGVRPEDVSVSVVQGHVSTSERDYYLRRRRDDRHSQSNIPTRRAARKLHWRSWWAVFSGAHSSVFRSRRHRRQLRDLRAATD